jgi:hypothetical protein
MGASDFLYDFIRFSSMDFCGHPCLAGQLLSDRKFFHDVNPTTIFSLKSEISYCDGKGMLDDFFAESI